MKLLYNSWQSQKSKQKMLFWQQFHFIWSNMQTITIQETSCTQNSTYFSGSDYQSQETYLKFIGWRILVIQLDLCTVVLGKTPSLTQTLSNSK